MRTVLLFILVNRKAIHNEIVALPPSVRLEVSIFLLTVAMVAMWVYCRNGNVGWQSVGLIHHFSPDWNISKLWDCHINHFELSWQLLDGLLRNLEQKLSPNQWTVIHFMILLKLIQHHHLVQMWFCPIISTKAKPSAGLGWCWLRVGSTLQNY